MGIVEEDVKRVRGEIGKVVFAELFQGLGEIIRGTSGVSGIGVSLIFMMA